MDVGLESCFLSVTNKSWLAFEWNNSECPDMKLNVKKSEVMKNGPSFRPACKASSLKLIVFK